MTDKVYVLQDIKAPWLNVTRRLQSVAQTEGYALVSITVLVGPDGCPKAWTEPKCVRIEPKRAVDEVLGVELLAGLGTVM